MLNAFDVLYSVLGIGLERGANNLAEQNHIEAVYFISDVVEDTEVRKHEKFVANFAGDALLRARRGLVAILSELKVVIDKQSYGEN